MDIAAIRKGLAAALAAAYPDWNVSAYYRSNPTLPQIDVVPAGIVYHEAMEGGWNMLHFTVRAQVAVNLTQPAQEQLDLLYAPSGVQQTLEADQTLGGVCDAVVVVECSEPKLYSPPGGTPSAGYEWTVQVHGN